MKQAECCADKPHYSRGLCVQCYRRDYRARNLEQVKQRNRAWRKSNPEKAEAATRAWRQANAEHVREVRKMYAHPRKYSRSEASKARSRERCRVWREANLDRARELDRQRLPSRNKQTRAYLAQRYRARLRDSCSPGVTAAEWGEILEVFGHACAYCLRQDEKLTRDHVEPIARGGRDEYSNLVPACGSCNSRKGAGTLLRFVSRP